MSNLALVGSRLDYCDSLFSQYVRQGYRALDYNAFKTALQEW